MFELRRAAVLVPPKGSSYAGWRHAALPGRACPHQLAPVLGASQCHRSRGEHDGMQLMFALLDVFAFMVVLVFMAGMALVPWLVDGAL